MEPLRWVLLLAGLIVIALIVAQSRGVFPTGRRIRAWLTALRRAILRDKPVEDSVVEVAEPEDEPVPPKPVIEADSHVVTVRILPQPGAVFPAEDLILALRAAGLRHGKFKIFHCMAEDDSRIRFSVASLVEPGSFDLNNLADTEYRGISMFMVLPAPEDGVILFDEMMATARAIAREVDGRLLDEQGGALSMQRERYMREEVIEFLRQQIKSSVLADDAAIQ